MTGANPGGPDQAMARIGQWADGFAAQAGKYQEVSRRTEELRLAATSAAGAVTVTVRADGGVTGIDFSPKARNIPLPELASMILGTMRQAQAGIAGRVGEVMAEQLGDDDPQTREMMLANLRERFPEIDEEPEAAPALPPPPAPRPPVASQAATPPSPSAARPRPRGEATPEDDETSPW